MAPSTWYMYYTTCTVVVPVALIESRSFFKECCNAAALGIDHCLAAAAGKYAHEAVIDHRTGRGERGGVRGEVGGGLEEEIWHDMRQVTMLSAPIVL